MQLFRDSLSNHLALSLKMGEKWAKNMLGLRLTDFELLHVPHPRLELSIHITAKCVQAGTLIGSLVAAPLYTMITGSPSDSESMKRSCIDGGLRGAAVGLMMGPLMSLLRCSQLNTVELFDRCYRIRFNRNQMNVDRCFYAGAAIGATVHGPAGFVMGVDAAVLAASVFNLVTK